MCKPTLLALFFATFLSSMAVADDVEIYFNNNGAQAGTSMVMFTLDYRSNLSSVICNGITVTGGVADFSSCSWTADFSDFNSAFDLSDYDTDGAIDFLEMLRAALRYVLNDPAFANADMQFGLMLNHNYINRCEGSVVEGCSNGAYVAMGFRDHNTGTPNGTEQLLEHLAAIPSPQGNFSHPFQGKELYFELFRYLTGQNVFNGHVGFVDYADPCDEDNLNDADGGTSCGGDDIDFDTLMQWDPSIESGGRYVSPWGSGSNLQCSGVYVVNFMFGVSNQDSNSDDEIEAPNVTGGNDGGLDMTLSGGNSEFNKVLKRLYDTDLADGTWGHAIDLAGIQRVTSYFVYNGNVQNTMNGYAVAGGGDAIEVSNDPRQLVEKLKTTFLEIIRQNSTFEAPAVTVNSYNRLSHLDSLYYALFGPELVQKWPGNLKKYRLGEIAVDEDGDSVTDYTVIAILDANGNGAVTADGLFALDACSYWSDCSTKPDGDEVALGGAANEFTNARHVYTYSSNSAPPSGGASLTSANNVVHEDTAAITAADLGADVTNVPDMNGDAVVDASDVAVFRTELLQIARGVEIVGADEVAIKEMGDPIHAQPAVVVYDGDVANAAANPDVAVVVATNRGYMHLIDADDGHEIFSFIPRELLPLVRKYNKDISASSGPYRFDLYGLDGTPVVLRRDNNGDEIINGADGDRVIVYLSQRRGGRNLYAVDITDRNNPLLLWRILGGVTTGFTDLAETWSEPVVTKIKISDVETDVLVFGGGYDSDRYDRDADDPDDGTDTGRSVYVVNALTGDLVWRIGAGSPDLDLSSMGDSIASAVKIIDFGDDHIMDRLYFIDVVGRIYRVDFNNSTSTTSIYGGGMIADLSNGMANADACDMTVSPNACRRFYNPPDVAVMTGFGVPPYIQLAVGSGFRAHPKMTTTQDRFYAVYDNNVVNQVATGDYSTAYHWTESNLVDVSAIGGGNDTLGAQASAIGGALMGAGMHGWYFDMDIALGEKVLSEPVTINGLILFTSYSPLLSPQGSDICSAGLGGGRLYLVNAYNGLPVVDFQSDPYDVLDVDDTVSNDQRYSTLPREGMPTDPRVVFKQKSDGTIEPTVVVGTQLPLDPKLLNLDLEKRTWWLEQ